MKDKSAPHYLWKYAIQCTIEDIRARKGHSSNLAAIRKIKINTYKSAFYALIAKLNKKITLSHDEQTTCNYILEISNQKEITVWANDALSKLVTASPSPTKEEEPDEIKFIQNIQPADQSSNEININLESIAVTAKLCKSTPVNIMEVQGIWVSYKDIMRVVTITVQVDKLLDGILFNKTQSDYFMKMKLKCMQTIQSHINTIGFEFVLF